MTFKYYYDMYSRTLIKTSDADLLRVYNVTTGIKAFNTARQGLFRALEDEFIRRQFDCTAIMDKGNFFFVHSIVLKNGKLYRLSEIPASEVELILKEFIKLTSPEQPLEEMVLLEYNNDYVTYRLNQAKDVIQIRTKALLTEAKPVNTK